MHKSRLGTMVIDCQTDDLDKDTTFWSKALGCAEERSSDPNDANYALLETTGDDIKILVQKVDHPSRVHLDIETDDIEAEVRRLEGLGATRVKQIRTWWVMEAPSGHRFCVVRPQRADFEKEANRWD